VRARTGLREGGGGDEKTAEKKVFKKRSCPRDMRGGFPGCVYLRRTEGEKPEGLLTARTGNEAEGTSTRESYVFTKR